MSSIPLNDFIRQIPKAELHIHIEGSFEPELIFEIAQRNGLKLSYPSVEALHKAYHFSNLQSFLDIYYEGAGVLIHEEDFYQLTWTYMQKLQEQGVVYAEIFFDPQTHTDRGLAFSTVIEGIHRALVNARQQLGISSKLIMCFLRHLPEAAAQETLKMAMPYQKWIHAVGLDSSEVGHPPSKFERVFAQALEAGFLTVAHAGEEGPAEYIWEALHLLKVSRIDHGNRCMEDEALIQELVRRQMPLTLCPISNRELRVVDVLENHPLKEMMNKGLLVTLNSDDPAYFRGSLNDNYLQMAEALDLSKKDIYQLAKNSFTASFLTEDEKASYIEVLDAFYAEKG